MNRRRFVRYMY